MTDAGRAALADWIGAPTPAASLRSEVAVKMRGASYGDRGRLLGHLEDLVADHRTRRAHFEHLEREQFPDPGSLSGQQLDTWLVLRGGIKQEQFWIEWLTEYVEAWSAAGPHFDEPDRRGDDMNDYPHLLEPITIGDLTLRNRAVMGSMHTGLEDYAWDMPKLAAYFAERARGGVGLIVTGGYAPTKRGWLKPFASELTSRLQAERHKQVTGAVHEAGGAIALQVLHAGRYGYTPFSQSASDKKSPITPFSPSRMSTRAVDRTATAFAETAGLAQRAGYDAVEVMGSEGYLINQFLAERTNDRDDAWGGTPTRRMRFPVEVVRRTREVVGDGFPIIYRISLLDLVEGGQTWDEVIELALLLEQAGATVLNTGIGWHEARVPTIITQVPRGAWTWTTRRLRQEVGIPVCASNRINTPELADQLIADGTADLVSMARPLLADPDFVNKAAAGRADEINTCIACNQACLDHAFANKRASCLVNPRACRETELVLLPDARRTLAPSPWSVRARRAQRRHVVRRARLRGHPVREGRRARRPVPAGDADPGQGGVRRDDALLRAAARGAGRDRPARRDRDPRGARRLRRGRRLHRGRAADARRSPASSAPTPTPTCSTARSCRAAGSR